MVPRHPGTPSLVPRFITSSLLQRLPSSLSRQHFKQAKLLFGIIGKKTAYAALLGAVFSATDAYVEDIRGKHDMTSGVIAGAITGTIFGLGRAMPQPLAWPLAFAGTAVVADLIGEVLPNYMKDYRYACMLTKCRLIGTT